MNNKLYFILLNLLIIITAEPKVKHFFIEENGSRCALLDLSVDISVEYETINGQKKTVTLDLANVPDNQFGSCSSSSASKFTVFNISLSENEILLFRFANESDVAEIETVEFLYSTPNKDFPLAKNNGTFSEYSNPKFKLSNTNNYFTCSSMTRFDLGNGTSVNIYSMKVKVFNVQNNSFGTTGEECSQNFSTSSSTESTVTTPIVTEITHKSEPTSVSTKSTFSTSSSTISTHQTASISTMSTLPIFTTSKPTTSLKFFITDNKTRNICLLMKSQLTVKIQYQANDNKTRTSTFVIQSNVSYNGSCSESVDDITLYWVSGLQITFSFEKTNNHANMKNVTVTYFMSPEYFNDSNTINQTITKTSIVKSDNVALGNYYECNSINYDIGHATLMLKDFQYEAFRNTKTETFDGSKTECGIRSPLVAIIVGVVLAAFLVIVVILFLIFRFKANKRKGYEEI